MHKSNFSLADLLTVLGTVIFGFFCFLSLNYYTIGETVQSIIGALIIALTVGGLAFVVKRLKITSRNFKICIIWEGVLLLLFAVVAIVAVFPFSHYFSVLDQKDEIQNKVSTNIDQAGSMFTDYEKYADNRENIYKRRLQSVVSAKRVNPSGYSRYGFVNETSDDVQVENKTFTLHAQLFPTNYEGKDGIKQVATNWLANAKNTLESKWAFTFGIVSVIKNSQTNIDFWEDKLKTISTFKAQGETANNYEYPLTFTDVTDKFINLSKNPATPSIIYAIILYVVMLLSYFVSSRHTRYPGLKVIFGTGGMKENEL